MNKISLKIAICIPTWNRAKFLPVAIKSLLTQKAANFDIHIFDNASTDNTEEIIKREYKNKVFYHLNSKNVGYVGNLNHCLSLTKEYDWIGILHSDDCHVGESVDTIIRYAERYPDVGIIFSKCHNMSEKGVIVEKLKGCEKVYNAGNEAIKRCEGQIPCSSTFYKSSAIVNVGLYSEEFPYSADEEYAARIAMTFDIVETKEILACYRRHSGHTMIKTWSKSDFIDSFEKMHLRINSYLPESNRRAPEEICRIVALILLGQCSGLVAFGHRDIVNRFYVNALKKCPYELLKFPYMSRMIVHYTPFLGSLLCKRLSKNAALKVSEN